MCLHSVLVVVMVQGIRDPVKYQTHQCHHSPRQSLYLVPRIVVACYGHDDYFRVSVSHLCHLFVTGFGTLVQSCRQFVCEGGTKQSKSHRNPFNHNQFVKDADNVS